MPAQPDNSQPTFATGLSPVVDTASPEEVTDVEAEDRLRHLLGHLAMDDDDETAATVNYLHQHTTHNNTKDGTATLYGCDGEALVAPERPSSSGEASAGTARSAATSKHSAAAPTPAMSEGTLRFGGVGAAHIHDVSPPEATSSAPPNTTCASPSGGKAGRAVLVTGLPANFTATQLRILLGRFGRIASCRLQKAPGRQLAGIASFDEPADAAAAVAARRSLLVDGKETDVVLVVSDTNLTPVDPQPAAVHAPQSVFVPHDAQQHTTGDSLAVATGTAARRGGNKGISDDADDTDDRPPSSVASRRAAWSSKAATPAPEDVPAAKQPRQPAVGGAAPSLRPSPSPDPSRAAATASATAAAASAAAAATAAQQVAPPPAAGYPAPGTAAAAPASYYSYGYGPSGQPVITYVHYGAAAAGHHHHHAAAAMAAPLYATHPSAVAHYPSAGPAVHPGYAYVTYASPAATPQAVAAAALYARGYPSGSAMAMPAAAAQHHQYYAPAAAPYSMAPAAAYYSAHPGYAMATAPTAYYYTSPAPPQQ